MGQRKAFHRQRVAEFTSSRKETVAKGILATSKNGDREIVQSVSKTSRPPFRIKKLSQLSQFR